MTANWGVRGRRGPCYPTRPARMEVVMDKRMNLLRSTVMLLAVLGLGAADAGGPGGEGVGGGGDGGEGGEGGAFLLASRGTVVVGTGHRPPCPGGGCRR